MELIDILDEKGNKTGEVKTYLEVHRGGLLHKTVHIWLVNSKNEILLQHRSKEKESHPNMWDISAAGHISSGEDSRISCVRETEEEIGVNITPDKFEFLGEVTSHSVQNNGTYINNEFQDIFLLDIDIDVNQLKMQDGEVDDLKWLSLEEFKQWIKDKKSDLLSHPEEFELLIKRLS